MHGLGAGPYVCPYPECDRSKEFMGFRRRWNLYDHMKRVHDYTGEPMPLFWYDPAVDGQRLPFELNDHDLSNRSSSPSSEFTTEHLRYIQRPSIEDRRLSTLMPVASQDASHDQTRKNLERDRSMSTVPLLVKYSPGSGPSHDEEMLSAFGGYGSDVVTEHRDTAHKTRKQISQDGTTGLQDGDDDFDTCSSVSTVESMFSTKSFSSETSQSSAGTSKATKDELSLILVKDSVLRPMYEEAFRRMVPEVFERKFLNLLGEYCSNLATEAQNDLEAMTISFLRPRRRLRYLTRKICDAYGPEDRRRKAFAKLQSQHNSKRLQIERFLRDYEPTNEECGNVPADSGDEEEECDAEESLPSIRHVKNFLISGQAMTKLRANLRDCIMSHERAPKATANMETLNGGYRDWVADSEHTGQ